MSYMCNTIYGLYREEMKKTEWLNLTKKKQFEFMQVCVINSMMFMMFSIVK